MPAPSDILQFMQGQLFQTPTLPKTSFSGRTVIVTGANTGLGFESAKQLVQLNVSTLILGCRSLAKGEIARDKILASYSESRKDTTILVWELDMASYASVKAFAGRARSELPRLDALVANAGISTDEFRMAEGLEETLTVNVVATFLLALLALPLLDRTAQQKGSPTHLAITGSNIHAFADHTQLQHAPASKVLRTLSDKDQADMASRYFITKLAVLQCVQEMSMRSPRGVSKEHGSKIVGPSVIVNCPNPGWCKTELFRTDDGGFWGRNMLKLIGRTSEVGGRTLTSAIAAGDESHGHYLSECRVKPASVFVRSEQGKKLQVKIWTELVATLEAISPGVTDVLS